MRTASRPGGQALDLVLLACIWLVAAPLAIANPSSYATASASCGQQVTFPGQPVEHRDAIFSLTSHGAQGNVYTGADSNDNFNAGDTIWGRVGAIAAQTSNSPSVYCSSGSVTMSLYDRPSPPVSFSGVASYDGTASGGSSGYLPVVSAGAGQYVADVSLNQGSIYLNYQTISSPGEYALGGLLAGELAIPLQGVQGPSASYTVAIKALPVAVSGLTFGQPYSASGATVTARFSVSGDTAITGYVQNTGGTVVRHLGSFNVPEGSSSLTWDGRGDGGTPLSDGAYTTVLVSNDPNGNQTSATTSLSLDTTPPVVQMTSPSTIAPNQSVTVSVIDSGSGVERATLLVDGSYVGSESANGTLSAGGINSLSNFSQPFSMGVHTWGVVAADAMGNRAEVAGSFTVANPSATTMHVDVPGPPCTKGAALRAARQAHVFDRFKGLIAANQFSTGWTICHAFAGHGIRDMAAVFICCTAASPTPLAVFRPVGQQWKLMYQSTRRLIYGFYLQNGLMTERSPLYSRTDALCCASRYRIFQLHWTGRTFASRLVRVFRP